MRIKGMTSESPDSCILPYIAKNFCDVCAVPCLVTSDSLRPYGL